MLLHQNWLLLLLHLQLVAACESRGNSVVLLRQGTVMLGTSGRQSERFFMYLARLFIMSCDCARNAVAFVARSDHAVGVVIMIIIVPSQAIRYYDAFHIELRSAIRGRGWLRCE